MEKTTKKRKKSKRLKRRIGLIAVGGLSFVLTICLSVGATLAWFAGSTWASNDLYMGGPVYVEMAGRGQNGYETGTDGGVGEDYATWTGGAGSLDIVASSRSTGTKDFTEGFAAKDKQENILLPGQKLLIYSQARVYSTLEKTTLADNTYDSESSGANNSNTSDGTYKYYNGTGSVQSTTTSVLRAKFSINIEFDPSVGFNNFTDRIYAEGYPVQSANYLGEYGTDDSAVIGTVNTGDKTSKDEASRDPGTDGKLNTADDTVVQKDSLTWASALGATPYKIVRDNTGAITSEKGRRDAVDNTALVAGDDYVADNYANLNASVTPWVDGTGTNDMWQVKYGLSKCIYQWKYVSKKAYDTADASLRIGAPFNGLFNTAGGPSAADKTAANGSGNGFYAIWVTKGSETTAGTNKANIQESGAFFKSRTSNYLKSYVEHYKDDYGRDLVMEIGDQLETLEDALNDSFVNLVNQSTDNIWAGNLMGFNAETDGRITYPTGAATPDSVGYSTSGIPASWLYVDPVIGNDTNSADNASSVGGWWYLVENDATKGNKTTGNNTIITEIDNVIAESKGSAGSPAATGATTLQPDGTVKYEFGSKQAGQITNNTDNVPADAYNHPIPGTGKAAPFQRLEDASKNAAGEITEENVEFVGPKDKRILNAKLYEIIPSLTDKLMATNPATGTTTTKVVSVAFPFVNGNFELPGQALTNVFANAKISFQITFQALQAFFPFSNSIDSIPSGTAITGTAKALNIGNAIPIYNEAFDYLSWL